MASGRPFISANPLGVWNPRSARMKVGLPVQVGSSSADGTSILIDTPRGAGGVFHGGTANRRQAAERNWGLAARQSTTLGVELPLLVDPFFASPGVANFVAGSMPVMLTFGEVRAPRIIGPGVSFTLGDPHHALQTLTASGVIGTSAQINEAGSVVAPVYIHGTAQVGWGGYRYWSGTPRAESHYALFALTVNLELAPSPGNDWEEAGNPAACNGLTTNWLVDGITDLAPGGDWDHLPPMITGGARPYASQLNVNEGSLSFQFGFEELTGGPTIRGYTDIDGDFSEVSLQGIGRIVFPDVYAPVPDL